MAKKLFLEDEKPVFLRVIETLVQVAAVCALGLFIARFLFFSVQTGSRAMEPTVEPGSVVFVDRAAYVFSGPKRFDVVAFSRSDAFPEDVLIRRIVGLPGEEVRIDRGTVYIDGKPLDIGAYASEITSDGIARSGIRLRDNEYFLLGDMPANAEDSRSSTVGAVPARHILGRGWMYATGLTDIHFIR